MTSLDLSIPDSLPASFDKTVITMRGFGSKNELMALYLNGALQNTQETRFMDEDEDLYKPLAQQLAQAAGYLWLEREAACVWQQASWETPPDHLSAYAALTQARYAEYTLEDVLSRYGTGWFNHEEVVLTNVYLLAGGTMAQAEQWVTAFVAQAGGPFQSAQEALFDTLALGGGHAPEHKRLAAEQAHAALSTLWTARLTAAWEADKPLTPLAEAAVAARRAVP